MSSATEIVAYNVEVEQGGCARCGHGQSWVVVGPDDVASSTSFLDKEDAEELADAMNAAYEAGRKSGGAE